MSMVESAAATPLFPTLNPSRIAVFRALQLGDMLCAIPALRALRTAAPGARITLIGIASARAFAARFSAYFDDFVSYPGSPGLPEQDSDPAPPDAFAEFVAEAQARGFDLAIQMHGDGSVTNAIVAALGARVTAGFCPAPPPSAKPGAQPAAYYLPYPGSGAEIRRLLALTTFLGAVSCGEHLEFPLQSVDTAEFTACPTTRGIEQLAGHYFCLHPGARDPARRWPPECFATVGEALYREYGLVPVITGSGEEAPLAAAVCRAMHAPAVVTTAPISVGALALVLAGARLLVCNDTGVAHLAAALHLPCVVVFLASEVARWAPLDQRLHRPVWASLAAGADAQLSAQSGTGDAREEVLRQARTLLAAATLAPPARQPATASLFRPAAATGPVQ